jgi:hypothetical protein
LGQKDEKQTATTNGAGHPAPKHQAMENLSATQYLQRKPKPPARCPGSQHEQEPFSPAGITANGFLTYQFLPLYQQGQELPEQTTAEPQLFASLRKLSDSYAINPMDTNDKPYPYNVLLAHWDVQRRLGALNHDIDLFIIKDSDCDFKFATKETLDTEMHLYYIPLLPLHRLKESRRDKRSAELLLSVCAYLYHGAGIPHYRDEDSYLHYHYEMLAEDLDPAWNGMGAEDNALNRSALSSASHFGDVMQRRMLNPIHLERFGERVNACKPVSQFQKACLKVANDALKLWQEYPGAHLFKNVEDTFQDMDSGEDDDYYNDQCNCIALYEYVHFVAEISGGIYHSICEMVNCEFNEKPYMQEPAVITRFDDNLIGAKNLDYERRLFTLINDLTEILDELP